ncbi:basic proline-rich protein-like [Mesoplodon densirostris]|uniref:basic proline-rich protein-like n=1 Tax=Mesoplodon densirostris TaxID=48708 RepID=UPI0028DB4492|nr:basic proline-rich protein-like [Mesoplodon densirostris]
MLYRSSSNPRRSELQEPQPELSFQLTGSVNFGALGQSHLSRPTGSRNTPRNCPWRNIPRHQADPSHEDGSSHAHAAPASLLPPWPPQRLFPTPHTRRHEAPQKLSPQRLSVQPALPRRTSCNRENLLPTCTIRGGAASHMHSARPGRGRPASQRPRASRPSDSTSPESPGLPIFPELPGLPASPEPPASLSPRPPHIPQSPLLPGAPGLPTSPGLETLRHSQPRTPRPPSAPRPPPPSPQPPRAPGLPTSPASRGRGRRGRGRSPPPGLAGPTPLGPPPSGRGPANNQLPESARPPARAPAPAPHSPGPRWRREAKADDDRAAPRLMGRAPSHASRRGRTAVPARRRRRARALGAVLRRRGPRVRGGLLRRAPPSAPRARPRPRSELPPPGSTRHARCASRPAHAHHAARLCSRVRSRDARPGLCADGVSARAWLRPRAAAAGKLCRGAGAAPRRADVPGFPPAALWAGGVGRTTGKPSHPFATRAPDPAPLEATPTPVSRPTAPPQSRKHGWPAGVGPQLSVNTGRHCGLTLFLQIWRTWKPESEANRGQPRLGSVQQPSSPAPTKRSAARPAELPVSRHACLSTQPEGGRSAAEGDGHLLGTLSGGPPQMAVKGGRKAPLPEPPPPRALLPSCQLSGHRLPPPATVRISAPPPPLPLGSGTPSPQLSSPLAQPARGPGLPGSFLGGYLERRGRSKGPSGPELKSRRFTQDRRVLRNLGSAPPTVAFGAQAQGCCPFSSWLQRKPSLPSLGGPGFQSCTQAPSLLGCPAAQGLGSPRGPQVRIALRKQPVS